MIQYSDFLGRLRRAEDKGRYIVALCPFHNDSTPSLLVFKDGWFHCLSASCSRSGTWKTLWNKISGQSVQVPVETRIHYHAPAGLNGYTSREELAYQAYIDLSNTPAFQWYLEIRGLADAVDVHEIGYYRGWYTFPVRDRDGKYQTTVFRAAPHVQEANPGMRYWSYPGEPMPYVPDWRLLDKSDYVLVVFGLLDALTLNKLRYPAATSTFGANTFKAEWLDAYRKPIYIVHDKGEEQTAIKLASCLGWRGRIIYLDYPAGLKDTNDFLRAGKEKNLITQLEKNIR